MKIMHVITGLNTGGAEMMLFRLLATTDCRRFQHEVVSLKGGGDIAEKISRLGIPITALGMDRNLTSLGGLIELRKQISNVRPDILQGWMYHGNLAASFANLRLKKNIPVVWNIRHSLSDLKNEKLFTRVVMTVGARFSGSVARIIYNARACLKQHEAFGFSNRNSVVIPNGFDTEHLKPSSRQKQKIRQSLEISEDEIVIGLVARYHPTKDHATFLRAVAMLSGQHPNVRFLLVGSQIEDSNPALAKLIRELDLKDRIILLGEQKGIPAIMASIDILCSSSRGEGFPNVVGEAMACAVPCVVTDVGDSAWIVGQTGIVAPPRDHQALATALTRMLDKDQDDLRKLGLAARRRIIDRFSLDQCVKSFECLYTSLVPSDPHPGG